MNGGVRVFLLVLMLLAVSVLPVGADEEASSEAPDGQWVFDVRVVKVVGTYALAEQPAPWAGNPIVDAAWPDLLATLKGRGTTTILMDQRVTGLSNIGMHVVQSRSRQLEILDRRDQNNESFKNSVLNEGCSAKLLALAHLDYEVQVQWSHPRAASKTPVQASSSWRGHAAHFTGSTLVLSHREQLDVGAVEPVTVELWAFVSAHFFNR